MFVNNRIDPVVLLLIFGLYFILQFVNTKCVPDLIYGIFLLICYIRLVFFNKKKCN